MIFKFKNSEKNTRNNTENNTANNTDTVNNTMLELDMESAMRYSADDEELYQEVVEEYCVQEKEYTPKLEQYYAEQNWKDFRILVHAIKGASLLVGANNFSEWAREIEHSVKEGDDSKAKADGPEFILTYRKLVEKLEQN